LFSFIYCYKLDYFFLKLKNKVYSGWISRQCNHFDMTAIISYPFNLIGGKYISIGENTTIGRHGVLNAWDKYMHDRFNPLICIGNNVNIGEYCHISAINKIIIGNGVLTGRRVTIIDNFHGKTNNESFLLPPAMRALYTPGPVIIDDNVWIGDKVTILPNVHIGKNAVIGANAVVSHDIAENCMAAGIPARIIKTIV
jgi:acetyltransferase-like isoleucine patch superfamily enzyme